LAALFSGLLVQQKEKRRQGFSDARERTRRKKEKRATPFANAPS